MNFDQVIDRRGTHASKWDHMERATGVSPDDGIAMWVADMDFKSADCIQDAVRAMNENGNYGYFGDFSDYKAAICWWMQNRHDWTVNEDWIFTTHGLCNAIGLLLHIFTAPDDGIVLFEPVYHAFARVVRAAGRQVVSCPLKTASGQFEMDFDAYDAKMTGREKMVILCSPHNPGGRIWTVEELKGIVAFCERHDLILVADEIHHDLIMPGQNHTVLPVAAPETVDRLIMLTSPSKTFNTAGVHSGNVTIPDPSLRQRFAATMKAFSVDPSNFGVAMTTAAYSPDGAAWVDELNVYLDGNRALFEQGINAIPGLSVMPLQATYLQWVNFEGTGMGMDDIQKRVAGQAKIAASPGPDFGAGGENCLRFNIGTQRANIEKALDRMTKAFSDLQ